MFLFLFGKSEKNPDIFKKKLSPERTNEVYVMKIFFELFRKKVHIERNSYLMNELIQDIHEVSRENKLQDTIRKHINLLERDLSRNSEILLDFI